MTATFVRTHVGSIFALILTVVVLLGSPTTAQVTSSTGGIQGTIVDNQGGVVTTARVTITNKATGQTLAVPVNESGVYASGSLRPGEYQVRVEATGFNTAELKVIVEVGVVSSGNVSLEVGSEKTVVAVEASAISGERRASHRARRTDQPADRSAADQRPQLPRSRAARARRADSGRRATSIRPRTDSLPFPSPATSAAPRASKWTAWTSATRPLGTTTQNIPQISIREFQIGQSSLDLSTELTSTGTVNVVTRSGTNDIHGEGFFAWRGDSVSAKLGSLPSPFDRKQFGARFGGPVIKDKLFFFGGFERAQQSLQSLQVLPAPFNGLSSAFDSPFHDTMYIGRVDWQARPNLQIFYRFSYEQNRTVKGIIPNNFQPFANADNTPVHAIGVDYSHGSWAHSLRIGYTKFRNGIDDAVLGGTVFDPSPGIAIEIGGDPNCLTAGADPVLFRPQLSGAAKNLPEQQTDQIRRHEDVRQAHVAFWRRRQSHPG